MKSLTKFVLKQMFLIIVFFLLIILILNVALATNTNSTNKLLYFYDHVCKKPQQFATDQRCQLFRGSNSTFDYYICSNHYLFFELKVNCAGEVLYYARVEK